MGDYNVKKELWTAVHIGNLRKVKSISNYLYKSEGWSADYELLCTSLLHKYINIAKFFLSSRNCEVNGDNGKNYKQYSALHLAIMYGDSSLVKTLLQYGANHNVRNIDGLLPIHLVVYRNPVTSRSSLSPKQFDEETSKIISSLLHYGVDIDVTVNTFSKYGFTALHLAAECNNERIIPILIKYSANFNARSETGLTPLHVAVISGNCKIVYPLLQHGVIMFPRDCRAKTPLCWAIDQEKYDVISILLSFNPYNQRRNANQAFILSYKDDYASMLTAVKRNNYNLVEFFLSEGANPNVSWKSGSTCLHIAIENENEDIVQLLLNYGANVSLAAQDGKTPMYLAVERNSLNIIKRLLKYVPDINESIYKPAVCGLSPLHLAVKIGSEDIIQLLLQCEKPESVTECDKSPLHIAVQQDNLKILRLLLENGENLETENSLGKTALQVATIQGKIEMVKEFCDFYSKRDGKWKEGYAALYLAAFSGNEKIVQILLESGADINARTESFLTPLFAAAKKGHLNIVQLLLKNGVDINECRDDGKTALHYAVQNEFYHIAEYILNNGANANSKVSGTAPLHIASFVGNLEIVKLLLKKGADVNARSISGATPLFIAVQNNKTKISKLLIQNGADVNIPDQETTIRSFNYRSDCIYSLNSVRGLRPLLVAIDNDNAKNVEILLKNGSPTDIPDERVSPLHLASAKGNTKIIKLLIAFGADMNWICEQEFTPLSHAISNGKAEAFVHLLSTGVNFQDNKNNSALHMSLSCAIEDERIVELLLDFGADVNAENCRGKTPMHCAISSGNLPEMKNLFRVLLDYGSSLEAIDKTGNTALHLAASNGDYVATEVLLDYGASIDVLNEKGFSPMKCLEVLVEYDLVVYLHKSRLEGSPYVKIARMFVALIALRETTGQLVSRDNLEIVEIENMKYFYEKCKRELMEMRGLFVCKNISYYDILTKAEHILFRYAKNQSILEALQWENLVMKVPCYAAMVRNRMREAKEKVDLMESSLEHFDSILRFKLPALITNEIFQYFSSVDMKNMARALFLHRNSILKQLNNLEECEI